MIREDRLLEADGSRRARGAHRRELRLHSLALDP